MVDKQNLTAHQKMQRARISLMKQFPFYGYLSIQLELVEDEKVGTAGVDGKGKMYYAPEFVHKLSKENLMFLYAHELGHLIFDHIAFKGKRNHIIWNMAGDYAINLLLRRDGVGDVIPDCLIDDKYIDWTARAIYDDLMQQAEENMKKYQESEGKDNHDMWGELSEEEQEGMKRKWEQAAVSAAHAAKAAGGEVPEAFRGYIDSLTTTKISWKEIVREKIIAHKKDDISWSRINRRRKLGSFNYPGQMPGEKVRFAVGLDVSGSYTQEMITEAMSEIYGATEEFEDVEIKVFQWDTRTYNEQVFTQDNRDMMLQYKIEGGGGTDFNCVIEYLKGLDREERPVQLFVFTDLYFSFMEDPLICPTTFIVNGNDNIIPPYGDSIAYDNLS
tara:strand:- start:68800 stop:69960 length:1161 start_codon:yes stop_codon:yes gene_type:complete